MSVASHTSFFFFLNPIKNHSIEWHTLFNYLIQGDYLKENEKCVSVYKENDVSPQSHTQLWTSVSSFIKRGVCVLRCVHLYAIL